MSQDFSPNVRKRFEAYSPLALKAEMDFWRGFDPMYFARIAAVVRSDESAPEFLDQDINLFGTIEDFQATQRSHLHFLRYLSSETLLLLIGAGYPSGPTVAFLANAHGGRLNRYLRNIATKTAPREGELGHCARLSDLSFGAWIKSKYFGHYSSPTEYPLEDLESFLITEAELVSERDAVNAMKHGRLMRAVNGTAIRLTGDDGKFDWSLDSAVRWLNWTEKSSASEITHSLQQGYEEASPDKDMQAILFAALHLKFLRDVRCLALELVDKATAKCPARDPGDGLAQRFVLTETSTFLGKGQ